MTLASLTASRRIQGPILDLVELSLDLNLAKNTLRLRFPFDLLPEVTFYEATEDPNPTQAKLCALHIIAYADR